MLPGSEDRGAVDGWFSPDRAHVLTPGKSPQLKSNLHCPDHTVENVSDRNLTLYSNESFRRDLVSLVLFNFFWRDLILLYFW